MKYFLIETDEKNRIPYNINKNRAIDIRMLTKEEIDRLNMWNVVEMELPMEAFFPDLICSPFVMVSESFMDVILIYHSYMPCKAVKLWSRAEQMSSTYFLPVIDEVECISDQTIFNAFGNRILNLVLDEKKIQSYSVFKIKNYEKNCIVGREDFVESLLRRDVKGAQFTEVKCV